MSGSRSTARGRIAHLTAFFGRAARAAALTTYQIRQYQLARRAAGAATGTINRETSALHRMGTFAVGTDAPICQDGRSGRQVCGLARSVVCHHALKDLAGEKAFETADDLPFGPPFSSASFDVVEGGCVELHPHDDGPVERGVGLSMTPR